MPLLADGEWEPPANTGEGHGGLVRREEGCGGHRVCNTPSKELRARILAQLPGI